MGKVFKFCLNITCISIYESCCFRQYIMEGLAAAFMFVLGGSGFIILDQTHATNMPKLNRTMLQFIGFGSLIIAFSCCWIFMKIKLPGYMNQ